MFTPTRTGRSIIRVGFLAACVAAGVLTARTAPGEPPASASTGALPAPATHAATGFRPSLHGFHFVNHFEGSPLPVSIPSLERSIGTPNTFGLCGGMSFAAADFFLSHTPVPADREPPAHGTPLYAYIYSRQTTSLGPALGLAAKFARWMALPESSPTGTWRLTWDEFPEIQKRLERGDLTVLGLVLVSSHQRNARLWENHQVLAYGITARDPIGAGGYDVHIYDPNFPGRDDVVIRATPRLLPPALGLPAMGPRLERPHLGYSSVRIVPGRATTTVRGFFAMPYSPSTPPRAVRAGETR